MIMNAIKQKDYISPQAEPFVLGERSNLLTNMSLTVGDYELIDLNDPSFDDVELDEPF